MKLVRGLGEAFQQKMTELAQRMDCSGMSALELHDAVFSSYEHLELIKREIFDWAVHAVNQPVIREDPALTNRCIEIARKATPIALYFLAVRSAALTEIGARSQKNKTNYYFGLLKFGHDSGIVELQKKAWGALRRIFLAIPYRKHWFHPEGKDGWLGVCDLAIANLLEEHAGLDLSSTLQKMTDNRFAYVYERIEARLVDEIRRLSRRPKELSAARSVSSAPASNVGPDEGLQRLAVIRLARSHCPGSGRTEAQREILRQIGEFLQDPDQIAEMTQEEVRAMVVRAIAQTRGVSEQQARKDLRSFQDSVRADERLQNLRDEIRSLGQMRMVVKPREAQTAESPMDEEGEAQAEH